MCEDVYKELTREELVETIQRLDKERAAAVLRRNALTAGVETALATLKEANREVCALRVLVSNREIAHAELQAVAKAELAALRLDNVKRFTRTQAALGVLCQAVQHIDMGETAASRASVMEVVACFNHNLTEPPEFRGWEIPPAAAGRMLSEPRVSFTPSSTGVVIRLDDNARDDFWLTVTLTTAHLFRLLAVCCAKADGVDLGWEETADNPDAEGAK